MDIDELIAASDSATAARVVEPSKVDIGGVDPLGLRQINFDMMDQILPGLNNVARHIRPYLLMTWAWRRAGQLTSNAREVRVADLRDFVDRIETIYAWSQFLINPETDLPGRQALARLIEAESYTFGGTDWENFRDVRRYSTGLIAAVNYGPGLRTMNWLMDLADIPDSGVTQRGAYKANPEEDPELETALDEFEACFADALPNAAFNAFGKVTVSREEARAWGHLWDMQKPASEGRAASWARVNSGSGRSVRSKGLQLVRFAAKHGTDGINDEPTVRRTMSDTANVPFPEELIPYAVAWRRMQVRQVFRLALEGLLTWTQLGLASKPQTTGQLAMQFCMEAGGQMEGATASVWRDQFAFSKDPIDHLDALSEALTNQDGFAEAAIQAFRYCVSEAPTKIEPFERSDRLPVTRAAQEWKAWADLTPSDFIGLIIERWLLAQHTYWSVGRGLQDARSNGKTILRLRIFIDEGGWQLAEGFNPGSIPNPTPDRIGTALSLLEECGQLS